MRNYLPFVILFSFFSHSSFCQTEDCLNITINKSFVDSTTLSYDYLLKGFGNIPIDSVEYTWQEHEKPFTIQNNCLQFCISFMGCGVSYKLLWNNEFRIDNHNRTIANIKFILEWTNDCNRQNSECLKYDLMPILNGYGGKDLYLNFIGYNKLLKIK
jgi:hypothetical protein